MLFCRLFLEAAAESGESGASEMFAVLSSPPSSTLTTPAPSSVLLSRCKARSAKEQRSEISKERQDTLVQTRLYSHNHKMALFPCTNCLHILQTDGLLTRMISGNKGFKNIQERSILTPWNLERKSGVKCPAINR